MVTLDDLTPRQRQIARLVGLGLSRREMAKQLSEPGRPLSIRTVDVHLRAIAALLPRDDLPASRRVRKWVRAQDCVRTTYERADSGIERDDARVAAHTGG